MKHKDYEKMWKIDSKRQKGYDISLKEKEFFNDNFDDMVEETEEDYFHWLYHTPKFNIENG